MTVGRWGVGMSADRLAMLTEALEDVRAANLRLSAVAAGAFPPGSRIAWLYRGVTQSGHVVQHNLDACKVVVCNEASGCRYAVPYSTLIARAES